MTTTGTIEQGQRWVDRDPRCHGERSVLVLSISPNGRWVECHLYERSRDAGRIVLVAIDDMRVRYELVSSGHEAPPAPPLRPAKKFYRRLRVAHTKRST